MTTPVRGSSALLAKLMTAAVDRGAPVPPILVEEGENGENSPAGRDEGGRAERTEPHGHSAAPVAGIVSETTAKRGPDRHPVPTNADELSHLFVLGELLASPPPGLKRGW